MGAAHKHIKTYVQKKETSRKTDRGRQRTKNGRKRNSSNGWWKGREGKKRCGRQVEE